MLAPTGKPTNLNERQWAQVRTPLFKRWFGDWEAVALRESIENSEETRISGKEIADFKEPLDMKALREKAIRWAMGNLPESEENSVLGVVLITSKGINDSIQHNSGPDKLKSIAAIPDMIKRGGVGEI